MFKKTFHDVMTTQELWQWCHGPLVNAIWPDEGLAEPGMMLFSNMLVGTVQFRQVRVSPKPCEDMHADSK